MFKVCRSSLRLSKWCLIVLTMVLVAGASALNAQTQKAATSDELVSQIRNLEKQLAELTAKTAATQQIAEAQRMDVVDCGRLFALLFHGNQRRVHRCVRCQILLQFLASDYSDQPGVNRRQSGND